MMKKLITLFVLLIAIANINAQTSNDSKQKAYEAKKVEEAYWDAVTIMYRYIIFDPINKGTYTPCFCYPLLDRVWVHTFIGSDNNLWVNIFYDNNGKVGDIFYATIIKSYGTTKFAEDIDSVVPSIEMKLDNGNLTFIQSVTDPYKFDILIW